MNEKYSYVDIRQSEQWFRFWKLVGWERVVFDTNLSARILKTFLGSSIIIEKPKDINDEMLCKIEKFAKDNKAVYLLIKPGLSQKSDSMEKANYDVIKNPTGVTKTGIIDLRNPIDFLFRNISKSERRLIEDSKNKIKVTITNEYSKEELDEFYNEYKQKGLFNRFPTYSKNTFRCFMESFKNNSYLCIVKNSNDEYLGGCVFVYEEKTAWYMFAAVNQKGRKLSIGYAILWEGIVFLKNKGFEFLDLEGLYDERYPEIYKSHQGYSSFKEHFHPDIVYYPKVRAKYFSKLFKVLDVF